MSASSPLYLTLAERLAVLIKSGTFTAGDRLPSIRQTSREHQKSITTVLEAYRILEDQGLIEGRQRSGYFVKPPEILKGQFAAAQKRPATPIVVEQSAIFEAVMDSVADHQVVHFASAAPDDSMVPHAKLSTISHAIGRRLGPVALRYTPPMGHRVLRAAVSRKLLGSGIDAGPDQIITTQGATEALLLALRATTKRGDIVAVECPTYFGILNLVRDLGLKAVEIPVDPVTGLAIDDLERALKKHRIAACLVQPNFQNPLGCLMPDDHKKRLAALSARHGFTLIEDDVYGELSHHGPTPSSIALFGGDVIHCGSVSKTIAPGLRVGWVVPGQHLAEIKRLKTIQAPWNASMSELIVAEFLEAGGYDRHLRRIREVYLAQCTRLREEVIRHFPAGCQVSQPRGGFVLWLEMPPDFDSEVFAVRAIARGISVIPGSLFSSSGRMKNYVRLSCGRVIGERETAAIATLGQLAAELMQR
ncbi:MAG: PLP-dependent aminotransferase family protein [Akkermansiaceae bacterium]|nr:PLP-dependent aminotransferase family protein [Akkermansiaceae bacterium]